MQGHRQLQVLHPVRVAQSASVAAYHQRHLGGGLAIDIGDHLVLVARAVLDGVPVYVQDKADGGVLGKVALDGRKGAVVGPGVGRVVVKGPVVEDADARGGKHLRHGVAHGHHVVAAVGGAVVAGPDHVHVPGGGVGLAAVGVDDEDLGPLPRQLRVKQLPQLRDGEGVVRAVGDVGPSADGVAAGVRGYQGPGLHAVVRGARRRQGRLLHRLGDDVFLVGVVLGGGLPLALLPQLRHIRPGGQQQRRLGNGQHRRRGQRVRRPKVPQLPAHRPQRRGPGQGLCRAYGGVASGGDGGQIQRACGQRQGFQPAQCVFQRWPFHGLTSRDNLMPRRGRI